jgi:hypothetical protein
MHNLQLILQEPQPRNHTPRNPRQYILRNIRPGEEIQRTRIHVFHAVVNARFDEESPVEIDDVGRGGAVEDVEFGDDGFQLGVVEFEADFLRDVGVASSVSFHCEKEERESETHLQSHRNPRRPMQHLLHRSVIPLPKLLEQLKVVHLDLERSTGGEVDAVGVEDRF